MKDIRSDINKLYIDEIADSLINGHASVMIGAGFSRNADPVVSGETKTFPTWFELSDKFCQKLGLNGENVRYENPLILAQEVEDVFGRTVLNKIIIDAMPDASYKPSDIYTNLLKLPWTDIFTTNYDTLLERARQFVPGHRYKVVTNQDGLVHSADSSRIIKLHGSLPSVTPFIITEEDYRSYPTKFAPFVNTVQQSLLENTFCLIGFSGDDPNFLKWIGWIHDNLHDTAPKIFMISLDGESPVKTKMLAARNIEVIRLSDIFESTDYRQCIASFLKDLNEKVNDAHDTQWPDLETYTGAIGEIPLKKIKDILEALHRSYPGWIAVPDKRLDRVKQILWSSYGKVFNLKSLEQDELDFCYEYFWLSEKICKIVPYEMGRKILAFKDSFDLQNYKTQYTLISLLRTFRLSERQDEWNQVNALLVDLDLPKDLNNAYSFEKLSQRIYSLQFEELKTEIEDWHVDKQDLEWVLRKCSLMTIVHLWSEALTDAKTALSLCRSMIFQTSGRQQVRYLSIESCFVTFINFLSEAINLKMLYQPKEWEQRTQITNYAAEEFFWETENDKLTASLTDQYQYEQTITRKPAFELGQEIITTKFTDDKAAETAYRFILFREITGIPYRIGFVTFHTGLYGAILRIARYGLGIPVALSVLSGEKKSVVELMNRSSVHRYSSDEVDSLVKCYIAFLRMGIFSKNEKEGNIVPDYALEVISEALARLCCKCSHYNLIQIYKLLEDTYAIQSVKPDLNLDHLTRWSVRADNKKYLNQDIKIFADFPIVAYDNLRNAYHPDPLSFILCDSSKRKMDDDISRIVNKLLHWKISSETRYLVIGRLSILRELYTFSVTQEEEYRSLIWRETDHYGLPDTGYLIKATSIESALSAMNDSEITEKVGQYIISVLQGEVEDKMFHGDGYSLILLNIEYYLNHATQSKSFIAIGKWLIKLGMKLAGFRGMEGITDQVEFSGDLKNIGLRLGEILLLVDKDEAEKFLHSNELNGFLRKLDDIHIPYTLIDYSMQNSDAFWDECRNRILFEDGIRLQEVLEAFRYILKLDFNKKYRRNYENIIDLIFARAGSSDKKNLELLLVSMNYLVKNHSDLRFNQNDALRLLDKNLRTTEVLEIDPEVDVSNKSRIRELSVAFASFLSNRLNMVSPIIDKWREISETKTEFNEVQNAWQYETLG